MFGIVIPILFVILVGFVYGRWKNPSPEAEAHINRYVMYIALPCMMFLAVANASVEELSRGAFLGAGLAGIAAAYGLGLFIARRSGIGMPQNAIVGMTASFGNTGYMGIPVLVAAFGEAAAAPAAIATIIHNIPAFFAVIMTFGACSAREGEKGGALAASLFRAMRAVLSNPLTVSAFAGGFFAVCDVPLPVQLETFTRLMAAAAAPTGLFVLGISLARMDVRRHISRSKLRLVLPVVAVKNVIQPAVTLLAALLLGMEWGELWLITAVVIAATPTGATTYLFAFLYKTDTAIPSVAIIISSVLSILTLPLALWALQG